MEDVSEKAGRTRNNQLSSDDEFTAPPSPPQPMEKPEQLKLERQSKPSLSITEEEKPNYADEIQKQYLEIMEQYQS